MRRKRQLIAGLVMVASGLASEAQAAEFGLSGSAEAEADSEEASAEASSETAGFDEPEPAEVEPTPPTPEPPKGVEVAPPTDAAGLQLEAFVDAYVGLQTARMGSPAPAHRAYATNFGGANENGFSLSFAGVDVNYDAGVAGATISLRAGPSVPIYYGGDTGPLGLDNITQAYATWRPTPALSLDLGVFGTIFGAEVAESWMNLNYTRGGLYYAMQPFWHTGARIGVELGDGMGLKFLVVDGVNNVTEVTEERPVDMGTEPDPVFLPTLGAQFTYAGGPLSVAIGGLFGPETDPEGFNVFFDAVATLDLDPLVLVFNVDYNQDSVEEGDDTSFYGVSLAAGYAITQSFSVAGRIEYLSDSDNALYGYMEPGPPPELVDSVSVTTLTATLDYKPIPDSDTLVLRWDNRFESGSEDVFFNSKGEPDGTWFASVFGVVVHGP